LGQKLKAEREKRKIALEEVAVATKIGTRMLQALEEEKFELLPGGIFNKNFVRMYAHYLGLDEQQAVADYMAVAGPAPEPVAEDQELRAIAERKDKERQQSESAGVPWGMVAVFLLALALGLSIWGFYSRDRVAAAEVYSHVPARPISAEAAVSRPMEQPIPISATPTSGSGVTLLNAASSEQTTRGLAERGTRSQTPLSEQPVAPKATLSSNDQSSFSVSVTALDNSWLTLTVDGNVLHHGMLAPPGHKTVEGHKEIVVKAGSIGALEILYNGKKLPPQGGEGEVRILTFHPDGFETQSQ